MKCVPKIIILIVITSMILLITWPVAAQLNYDLTYTDSEGDVQMFDYENMELITDPGHQDIDILEVKSSKATLKQNLILELTVAGKIIDSETVNYGFTILDDDEESYMVMYYNGSCSGMSLTGMDFEEDILVALGAGTDTLTVTVPLKNIGLTGNYDFYSSSTEVEIIDEEYYPYMDSCPDQLSPWDYDDGYDD